MGIEALDIELINKHLKEKISPYLIMLYGSAAKGGMHPGSDIDIAFLSDKKVSAYEIFMIAQELADVLGKDVDLVDLQQASTVFQTQVVGYGKTIFCSDDYKRMQFEMLTLKKYAKLNEERQCILENNDVILNKVQVIERCLIRVQKVYDHNPDNLNDYTKQDSIILNIQRACEASIDLAMHIVSNNKLGIPQTSGDAFDILSENDIIDAPLAKRLKAMVGFRNIAVHDYQKLNLNIIQKIIEDHLADFKEFAEKILRG